MAGIQPKREPRASKNRTARTLPLELLNSSTPQLLNSSTLKLPNFFPSHRLPRRARHRHRQQRIRHRLRRPWRLQHLLHRFRHALRLLLLRLQPASKRSLLARHAVQVPPDALAVVRLHQLQLRLYLNIFFRLARPLRLGVLPLLRRVRVNRFLAHLRVLQHFVRRHARRIQRHQHRRAPQFSRRPAQVLAPQHLHHLADAVAPPRTGNPCRAINIFHWQKLALESAGAFRRSLRGHRPLRPPFQPPLHPRSRLRRPLHRLARPVTRSIRPKNLFLVPRKPFEFHNPPPLLRWLSL